MSQHIEQLEDIKTIQSNLRDWCYSRRRELEHENPQWPLFNCMDQAIISVLAHMELRLRKIEVALTPKTGEDEKP